MVLVAAHPGHQRQALVELQAVLGEQGEGAGLAARVRPVGRAAFEVAGRGMPGVDVVAADIGIGRVVAQAEADAVVLGADQGAAVEAEQGVLEGCLLYTSMASILRDSSAGMMPSQLLSTHSQRARSSAQRARCV